MRFAHDHEAAFAAQPPASESANHLNQESAVLWIALALIIAIPAWLGLSRPGSDTTARRLVGRCLLYGVVAGALASGGMWLASADVPTSSSLLYGPAIGAAAGAAVGLCVALPRMFIARVRQGKHEPPAA